MTYNGWENYETWNVSLWLSNEEGLYNNTQDMAREYEYSAHGAYELGEALKAYVDDLAETTCPGSRTGASFVCDLLGSALSEVDWEEIAKHLLEEVGDAS